MYAHAAVFAHEYVHMCVHVVVYTCVSMCVHVYAYLCACICVRTRVYVYVKVYVVPGTWYLGGWIGTWYLGRWIGTFWKIIGTLGGGWAPFGR